MRWLKVRYRPAAIADLDEIFDAILRVSANQGAVDIKASEGLCFDACVQH
jgi:hypothetical protein